MLLSSSEGTLYENTLAHPQPTPTHLKPEIGIAQLLRDFIKDNKNIDEGVLVRGSPANATITLASTPYHHHPNRT